MLRRNAKFQVWQAFGGLINAGVLWQAFLLAVREAHKSFIKSERGKQLYRMADNILNAFVLLMAFSFALLVLYLFIVMFFMPESPMPRR